MPYTRLDFCQVSSDVSLPGHARPDALPAGKDREGEIRMDLVRVGWFIRYAVFLMYWHCC